MGPIPLSGSIAARAEALYRGACDLLLENKVAPAIDLIKQCRALDPSHYHAARTLAAIAMRNGYDADGRAVLLSYYRNFPYKTMRANRLGKEPAVLLIRGFSGTHVIPWQNEDGQPTTRFRGGHFTTQYLLREPSFPMHRFTIAGDNILRPGVVPEHALMINTIADPDLEIATLKTLALHLERTPGANVINHPSRVLPTTREANYQRFRGTRGLVVPETHRVRFEEASVDEVSATIKRLGLGDGPVILRATGTHTARSTGLIRSRADLETYLGDGTLSGDHYLIRYIEVLWNGAYFRKMRLFWIGDAFYPVVCHLDTVWNVHGGNRKEIMRGDAALMAEEKRFLADWKGYVGTQCADVLERVAGEVGLEFFGVDFTVDDAGRVLVYELNPAMRHAFDHGKNFPYKLPYDHAVSEAFEAMVDKRLQG